MRYQIICWRTIYGACANIITTTGAIGDDGVGNIESAKVVDAAAITGCRIAYDGGIG
ncbi:MAG: hypothetical protein ACKO16_05795 [Gemmataceae bacterium]